MELFSQMIYYVRAQQVISNFYSFMSNNLDQFTFFTRDGLLVSETFDKDSKLTDRLIETYFLRKHPVQQQTEMQTYYDSCDYLRDLKIQPGNILNYDAYVEKKTNQDEDEEMVDVNSKRSN